MSVFLNISLYDHAYLWLQLEINVPNLNDLLKHVSVKPPVGYCPIQRHLMNELPWTNRGVYQKSECKLSVTLITAIHCVHRLIVVRRVCGDSLLPLANFENLPQKKMFIKIRVLHIRRITFNRTNICPVEHLFLSISSYRAPHNIHQLQQI